MAENFMKNMGTLGCEEARSQHSKYNIKVRQKISFSKLIFPYPEHFGKKKNRKTTNFNNFLRTSSEKIWDFKQNFFGRVVKTAFY